MENRYGYFRQGSGVWKSFTDGDFEEEEVWAVIKERRDSSAPSSKVSQFINNSEFEPSFSVQRRLPSAARMVPKTSGNGSSTSGSSNSNSPAAVTKLQSAPVKIPDWSKFNGHHHHQKSKKSSKNVHGFDDDDDENYHSFDDDDDDDEDDDDDDGYDSRVPPHEFIARRQSRSQISSFSVFEGVGRTLKGRDLSKVRNAVLTRTGFLEE